MCENQKLRNLPKVTGCNNIISNLEKLWKDETNENEVDSGIKKKILAIVKDAVLIIRDWIPKSSPVFLTGKFQ